MLSCDCILCLLVAVNRFDAIIQNQSHCVGGEKMVARDVTKRVQVG